MELTKKLTICDDNRINQLIFPSTKRSIDVEREHNQDIELQKLNKKTKEFEEKSNEIKRLMESHGIGINFDGYDDFRKLRKDI